MKITDALKKYRIKKAEIESTYQRIAVYQKALTSNNICMLGYYTKHRVEAGMPKARNTSSQVETEIFNREEETQLTKELVREWIKDERRSIYMTQIEVEQIDAALGSLTRQEKYIIECKYFDNMSWRDVEISFNSLFQYPIVESSIQDKNSQALKKLTIILMPFYSKFTTIEPILKK